jgi:hypothetical protein
MNITSLDKAAVYLHNHGESEEGSVNARTLLRKIDWIILPLAFLCYAVQFIDKININVCVLAPVRYGIDRNFLKSVCSCHGDERGFKACRK